MYDTRFPIRGYTSASTCHGRYDELISDYPYLDPDITAALEFSTAQLSERTLPASRPVRESFPA